MKKNNGRLSSCTRFQQTEGTLQGNLFECLPIICKAMVLALFTVGKVGDSGMWIGVHLNVTGKHGSTCVHKYP